ncbi:MAG: hypothetical protein JXR22_02610 [Prolixibacteraceae bacterium]|nr:hypothetical protein [Prolixibacteraceae bacterium]
MKTKVFYLSTRIATGVVLLAILAVKAFAGEAPKVKMVPYSSDKAIIAIDNAFSRVSELSIENEAGSVIYYKDGSIDEKIYSKVFDFKNLSDGIYTIRVRNTDGEKSINFKVKEGRVEMEKETSAMQPYIEVKDDVLKLSMLNHTLSNVEINLSDKKGNVFNKDLGKQFSINAGFSLARLEKGNYELSISNGSETVNYQFEK